MFLSGLGLLWLTSLSHASLQSVLGSKQSSAQDHGQSAHAQAMPSDDGSFRPIKHPSALSFGSFTTFSHWHFPEYSIRMKKSNVCAGEKAVSYTGYIDVDARHIFFYFFESRNDPATDDIIFWTNGGPGCSSAQGLFMELGPCRALSPNGTTYHGESWNTNANIFFVDQPIGVGFSYADRDETVSTTEEAAKDIAAFIFIFFETFSAFKGHAFHLAGQSYGGRYIPFFDDRKWPHRFFHYDTIVHRHAVYSCLSPPGFEYRLPKCQKRTLESCIDQYDVSSCGEARAFCDKELCDPYRSTGLNPYDISMKCGGENPATSCYSAMGHIKGYLDIPVTRTELGVDQFLGSEFNFDLCNMDVYNAFIEAQDLYHQSYTHIAELLERGVRALIYVGTYDWIGNWIGNERWTLEMPWTGQKEFVNQPLREWTVDGRVVGKTRNANGLAFATIDGAGHMVPYDKPKEALALVKKWLAEEEL